MDVKKPPSECLSKAFGFRRDSAGILPANAARTAAPLRPRPQHYLRIFAAQRRVLPGTAFLAFREKPKLVKAVTTKTDNGQIGR
jgi:hypothetical protein